MKKQVLKITCLKHDGTTHAMLLRFSYYFTDNSGLDSRPSALQHRLELVLMSPLPAEEKI